MQLWTIGQTFTSHGRPARAFPMCAGSFFVDGEEDGSVLIEESERRGPKPKTKGQPEARRLAKSFTTTSVTIKS